MPEAAVAQLPDALAEAEAMLKPIAPKDLYVLLGKTLRLWKAPEDWDEIAPFYREALEDFPRDLVEAALKHVRQTCKWFPKYCELRTPVEVELERRRHVLRRLRIMELKASRGEIERTFFPPVPSAEEKAAVSEMAARAKRVIAENPIKPVPKRKGDDKEAVSVAEAYAVLTGRPFVERKPAAEEEEGT